MLVKFHFWICKESMLYLVLQTHKNLWNNETVNILQLIACTIITISLLSELVGKICDRLPWRVSAVEPCCQNLPFPFSVPEVVRKVVTQNLTPSVRYPESGLYILQLKNFNIIFIDVVQHIYIWKLSSVYKHLQITLS